MGCGCFFVVLGSALCLLGAYTLVAWSVAGLTEMAFGILTISLGVFVVANTRASGEFNLHRPGLELDTFRYSERDGCTVDNVEDTEC